MKKALAVIVGLLLLAALVLFSTTYTVRFHEVAVKTTFGKADEESVRTEPGIHFRLPLFADRVTTYDTRLQFAETPLIEVPTVDGQSVVVRTFLMWRINPARVGDFARSFPQDMADAEPALREQLQTAVRASLGKYAFDDLIGPDSRLPHAEADVRGQLESLGEVGIEPVLVGISQVKLPAKTTKAVLARMQATRQKLAETERFRGNSEAAAIEGEANSLANELKAFAELRSEEIKGTANRKAAEYLAQMSVDEEFAIFLAWVDALKRALEHNTTFFLSDEAAPWHLLDRGRVADAREIPQPSGASPGLARRGSQEAPGDAD